MKREKWPNGEEVTLRGTGMSFEDACAWMNAPNGIVVLRQEDEIAEREIEECGEDCGICSGEFCVNHGVDPCDCDVVERHDFRNAGVK